eukprot:1053064-Alexandrium_andersonii.AAC.1
MCIRDRGKCSAGPDRASVAVPGCPAGPPMGVRAPLVVGATGLVPAVGDVPTPSRKRSWPRLADGAHLGDATRTRPPAEGDAEEAPKPVSYTHLTLPTICSV